MRHHQHRPGVRLGVAVMAFGLALGTASVVAVVNALFDSVA